MSAPAFVNQGTRGNVSFGTSVTPNLPASLVNGNLLLACVSASVIGQPRTFTFPVGWTPIGSQVLSGDGNSALAYRIVDGSETDPTITWTGPSFGGADDGVAIIFQYSGVYAADPIGANTNTIKTSSSVTPDDPGITELANNSLTLGVVLGDSGANPATANTGWTLDGEVPTGNGTIAALSSTSADTAGDPSPAFAPTMSASRRWQTWLVELCSEAPSTPPPDPIVLDDIEFTDDGGFSQADLTVTPPAGTPVTFATTTFVDDQGFKLAAIFITLHERPPASQMVVIVNC